MKPSIPLLILNRNEFLTTDMLAMPSQGRKRADVLLLYFGKGVFKYSACFFIARSAVGKSCC